MAGKPVNEDDDDNDDVMIGVLPASLMGEPAAACTAVPACSVAMRAVAASRAGAVSPQVSWTGMMRSQNLQAAPLQTVLRNAGCLVWDSEHADATAHASAVPWVEQQAGSTPFNKSNTFALCYVRGCQ